MTIVKATLKSAADQQLTLWNSSGPHVIRATYTPTAGMSWCVLGCVMADAFDPDLHETVVINGIQALAAITSVVNPRMYGETPETIECNLEGEDPTHEVVLYVESNLSCQVGAGDDKRSRSLRENEKVNPPVGKQWLVLNCVVPTPLDTAGIAALETAVEGVLIGGVQAVTTCEHLIGDTVPSDATSISLQIESRIRIDRIPVEE